MPNKALRFSILIICAFISSCLPPSRLESATLVMGSWYGFFPIYYAKEHGLDKQFGLQLKVLEPSNIGNLRRSYLRSHVDFAASSTLEFTNAVNLSKLSLSPVLFTDYSNGGDVIVANKTILNTEQLVGKRVAVPAKGIGEYILSLVFDSSEPLTLIEAVSIFELECGQAFIDNKIEACVTYPPISTHLLEQKNLHLIYSSKEHPYKILDLIWAKPHVRPSTKEKFRATWFAALKKIEQNPEQFYDFVASITNTSTSSVKAAMSGIKLIDKASQKRLRDDKEVLAEHFIAMCNLVDGKNCQQFKSVSTW